MALIEFKNLPDTTTPITAENLNNNFQQTLYKIQFNGNNIEEFQNWLLTEVAPTGNYLCELDFNGAVSTALVEKANGSWLSFIWYSYYQPIIHYQYLNGEWRRNPAITPLYNAEINTKTTITLNDNVNKYDFIIVLTTSNAYSHRRITNIYMPVIMSSTNLQLLQYSPSDWDYNLKIYDSIIDTTQCDIIGTNNCRITAIYGIRL